MSSDEAGGGWGWRSELLGQWVRWGGTTHVTATTATTTTAAAAANRAVATGRGKVRRSAEGGRTRPERGSARIEIEGALTGGHGGGFESSSRCHCGGGGREKGGFVGEETFVRGGVVVLRGWERVVEATELVDMAHHVLAEGADVAVDMVFGVREEGEEVGGEFLAPVGDFGQAVEEDAAFER